MCLLHLLCGKYHCHKNIFVFMPEKIYSAQILGMFTYTITGFILNKFWAMK
ncbi:hypothetical protein A79E_1622 [Klebsiella pneumoniae subsp. pneumoniae 1084]|nr:hypothetical protein A79E_1622 [Klebsiella pneumoniae subsp. pneumoniae 1084]